MYVSKSFPRWCRRLAVALLIPAALVACDGGDAADPGPLPEEQQAFSHPLLVPGNALDELPEHTTPISPEAFARLLDDGDIVLTTDASRARMEIERAERFEAYARKAATIFPADVIEDHTRGPDPDDEGVTELPDGNYELEIGNGQVVVTQGERFALADMVAAHESFHQHENQLAIYRRLFERLPQTFRERERLPDPDVVGGLTSSELEELNYGIQTRRFFHLLGGDDCIFAPESFGRWWREEGSVAPPLDIVGVGGGGDGLVGTPSDNIIPPMSPPPQPTGLAATACYPLKWHRTSVKNQGRRGTCVAFCITAAVESAVSRDFGRYMNLSEQMLYNRAKQVWDPAEYGDGLSSAYTLDQMMIRSFSFPLEWRWDYNPCPNRVDVGNRYVDSCRGYEDWNTEYCSNAVHQARWVSTKLNGYNFGGYYVTPSVSTQGAGFRITNYTSIWYPGQPVAYIEARLLLGDPVVFSCHISASFNLPGTGGYVPYVGTEGTTGGHCMELVGYVPNDQLPAGVAPAQGGGWFIAKNSWGNGVGDAGYHYLQASWVARFGKGAWAIHSVGS